MADQAHDRRRMWWHRPWWKRIGFVLICAHIVGFCVVQIAFAPRQNKDGTRRDTTPRIVFFSFVLVAFVGCMSCIWVCNRSSRHLHRHIGDGNDAVYVNPVNGFDGSAFATSIGGTGGSDGGEDGDGGGGGGDGGDGGDGGGGGGGD